MNMDIGMSSDPLNNDEMESIESRPDRQRRFSISEMMGRMYQDNVVPPSQEHIKRLGEFIKFSNEGKLTKAEQVRRDRKMFEINGFTNVEEPIMPVTTGIEVIGTIDNSSQTRQKPKGLEVSFVNGQIVLDRTSLNRQVDRFDVNDDDEPFDPELANKGSRKKRKMVVWSVAETREFFDCLRRYGTDFFMMSKVLPNRTRNELKNKFKTEEKRNIRLVSMILAVHLKERVHVPELPEQRRQIESVPAVAITSEALHTHTEEEEEEENDEPVLGALSESSDEGEEDLLVEDYE